MNSRTKTGADKTEGVLESIRKLKDEKPRTLMGQIRWMLPDIEAAIDSGHSLTDIHAMLNKHEIEIPYKQLSLYLGRIRRQEEKSSRRTRISERSARTQPGKTTHPGGDEEGVNISPTSEGEKLPLLKADPLANLKKALGLLYSIATLTSSAGSDDFNRFKAFLGRMKDVVLSALASLRR